MTDREPDWDYPHGETPDVATSQALQLAHQAIEKFPELAKRYRSFAGPAVIVSGALVALAGVAVARRIRKGQRPEEILNEITSEEIEQAATVTSRQNRWWRMLARISRRRQKEADEAGGAL
jgi:hypothetical protein